jgi:hypothetical protein
VWHYKCIRPILNGPTWPNFLCPNCRAVADLEEDVEDPADYEDWEDEAEQENDESTAQVDSGEGDGHITPRTSTIPLNAGAPVNGSIEADGGVNLSDLQREMSSLVLTDTANGSIPQTPEGRAELPASSVTHPVTINVTSANGFSGLTPLYPSHHDGLTPGGVHDGPMTPRNDAGPFVLDGSAGRAAGSRLRDASPGSDSGSTHSGTPSLPNSTTHNGPPTLPPVRFD